MKISILCNHLRALLLGLAFVGASAPAPAAGFRPDKLTAMDAAINEAIADQCCPGGVLWVEHGGTNYHKAFGHRALVPVAEAMTEDTIFDAASLTKVVACTPAVMLLVERGQVKLDEWVETYLPEFTGGGKEGVTVRQLLTHTSGLRPDISLKPDWQGYAEAIRLSAAEKIGLSGTHVTYSDTGMILLGEIVRRVTGQPLNEFVQREIYTPLGMKDTGFNPPKEKLARIAPTEVEGGVPVRGVVHDPRSRRMGGVAGHAGLFLTAGDLARYARMMLNQGELDGVRIFQPATVELMTSVQTPPNVTSRRGLGWDIDSGYSGPRGKVFPLGSYGHTGWTGTSLWIDPFSKTFVIFLSNRNHPKERGNVGVLRATLGTLAAEAVTDVDFTRVSGALPPREPEFPGTVAVDPNPRPIRSARDVSSPAIGTVTASATAPILGTLGPPSPLPGLPVNTLNGIDVLVRDHFAPLKGKRLGLITNHTGHDRERHSTIDLLRHAPGVTLVALFSPEHGIRGAADEKVGDSRDEATGLPVFSLYGATRKPKPEQLKNLDALVFDIQDVGCRFYTYAATMGLVLEAAAENGKEFFVLDRVNPVTGSKVEGPVLAAPPTFVGFYPVPLRHGMTLGELAMMYNSEKRLNARLTVIAMENWKRDQWFDETGLPWTNPSPNMRRLNAAILYPGVGLLESALSVGRGTDTPFEIVGAPYIEEAKFAAELNRAGLPGVRFGPVRFTPTASVHQGQVCGGVRMLLTDRNAINAVDIGLLLATTLHRWYPNQFPVDQIKHLLLHPATLAAIKAGKSREEIAALWPADCAEFERRRQQYLIYK